MELRLGRMKAGVRVRRRRRKKKNMMMVEENRIEGMEMEKEEKEEEEEEGKRREKWRIKSEHLRPRKGGRRGKQNHY